MYEDYYKDVFVVKASEGSPEVFKDGKYWNDFGINYDKSFDNITLDEALEVINNPDEQTLKLAKFNIALYLVFACRVESLEEAWKRLN